MKKFLIISILLFSVLYSQDQGYIDSLKTEIRKAENEAKLSPYVKLAEYLQNYSPRESIELTKEAITLSRQHKSEKLADLYLILELNYSKLAKYDSSFYYSAKAKEIYTKHQDTLGLINATNSIGIYYLNTDQQEKASESFTQIKTLAQQANKDVYLAMAYTNLGVIDMGQSKYNAALEKFLHALSIYQDQDSSHQLINIYVNLGSLFLSTNNYEKSIDYFFKGLKIAEDINDNYHLWYIYYNLGFVYEQKKEYQKALEYAEKSIDLAKISNNDLNLAYGYLAKIQFLIQSKQFENLEILFAEVENIAAEINSEDIKGYIFDLRCDLAIENENFQEAEKYHQKSWELLEKSDYMLENKIYHNIRYGKILAKLGEHKKAIKILEEALQKTDNFYLMDLKLDAYENMYEIYEDQENYPEAFRYLKLYSVYTDSMYLLQNKSNLEELEIIHNIEQRNKQNELLTKENQITTAKLKSQQTLLITIALIAVLVFIITLGIIYVLIARRKNLKRLKLQNRTIQKQKRQLEKTIASKDRLYSIIGHDLYNAHSNISSFINILKRTMDRIDKDFIKKLTKELEAINNNALQLLNTLTEWGKIQTKKTNYSPVNFNLKALVYNNLLIFDRNIEEKALEINNDVNSKTEVFADKKMIGTVMRNLISNAVKFTPQEGALTIRDNVTDRHIQIEITDTGIGIEKENLDKLFQIEETITTRGTSGEYGHGLGLIICKELIDLHNGKIEIRSTVKKGTTVTITLPKIKSP